MKILTHLHTFVSIFFHSGDAHMLRVYLNLLTIFLDQIIYKRRVKLDGGSDNACACTPKN